ncbi:MAG: hypothetical protein LBJ72_06095 [Dysgonamonadaceae bacterium]|jgi:hypothetical protein|nr:hypothetical protein [Dysgonamonadaceae bacterium]
MRIYKLLDAFDVIKESFSFLIDDWNFENIRADNLNYACVLDYQNGKLIIRIVYEYIDNTFNFFLIVDKQQKWITDFFEEREDNFDWKLFQPDDFQYKESLIRNVEYLQKYKEDVFKLM